MPAIVPRGRKAPPSRETAQRADTHRCGCFAAPASGRNSIWNVIVPADGTSAAAISNGDFGTSAFYGQLSDKPLPACIRHVGYRTQSTMAGREHKRRAPLSANRRKRCAFNRAVSAEPVQGPPSDGQMFRLLLSLMGAIAPICVHHRPIDATRGAGKVETSCAPA